ncbi:Redoxin-domain-containing protein [Hypoxylon rubiginosum]|uniref:Redoxin-domain-containing protein n=1 Tax=Hypoxylon rubiginosum TaxID=110542 RepID=A0ACB9YTK5_9PEZI|nr:Redoxin-domain-containing protein [Hypoxylon rubiginosum]
MAFRLALRRGPTATSSSLRAMPSLASSSSSSSPLSRRAFHGTPRALQVQVGEPVPDLDVLHEDSPGNKVNLARELGSGVIVGVPAAFSGACSQKHVPSYIQHPKLRDAGKVFVVAVNDAFVMKAWADQLDPTHESGIRFLADPSGEFTKALDLGFEAPAIFGDVRAKRYALVIEDGKVKNVYVEPDNTGTTITMADKVLA